MTNKRRYFLTAMSLCIGMAISMLIIYMKKGGFNNESWLYLGTVFGYSLLIVAGIGWYLQKKANKNN